MKVMFFILLYLLNNIRGHTHDLGNEPDLTLKNDADLQAELLPQELNSDFVSSKDSPWRAIIPLNGRNRRETDVATIPERTSGVSHNAKLYSRIASCIALAVAAIIEIVLYILEFYT